MSRYDYRVKRQLFQKRNVEKYKNFRSFEKEYLARSRFQKLVRFLLILIALILLIFALIFTVNAETKKAVPYQKETLIF